MAKFSDSKESLEGSNGSAGRDNPRRDKDTSDDASFLIDPNLSETRDAFGREVEADASVGAAAAALHEDRAKTAATEPPRASAPAARRKNVDAVPGLEPEDGNLGIEPSVAKAHEPAEGEPSTPDKSNEPDGAIEKVSELTMLGVEEMLRRSERGGERRWRIGWIASVSIVLASLGTVGFLLHRHAGSFEAMPKAAEELANEWVIYPVSDSMAPEDRFSIRGLQLAIETGGWRPEGQESVIETTSANKVIQTYVHRDQRIQAAFHHLSDRAEARKLVERTQLPARAVGCDTKVVVLEPAGPNPPDQVEADHVEGLALLLERYRTAVIDAPAASSP